MRAALLAIVLSTASSSAMADEVPKAMRGVWTDSAVSCEAYTRNPSAMPAGSEWVAIGERRIVGTTKGWLIAQTGPRSFSSTGSGVEGVDLNYELRQDGLLSEVIGTARGANLYLRCGGAQP